MHRRSSRKSELEFISLQNQRRAQNSAQNQRATQTSTQNQGGKSKLQANTQNQRNKNWQAKKPNKKRLPTTKQNQGNMKLQTTKQNQRNMSKLYTNPLQNHRNQTELTVASVVGAVRARAVACLPLFAFWRHRRGKFHDLGSSSGARGSATASHRLRGLNRSAERSAGRMRSFC